ncbi:MAG: hypothetical protein BEN18_05810 [Epulopiscium sp. Nuni2H_MBin001]|nr:MAG: hypothetical protein BEN18_05810 [Epulopiscium sp. Nuni2H_MBin001]
MKEKLLFKTNILICLILFSGILLTSLINYMSNSAQKKYDLENIATLVSESIYYQVESYVTEPLHVSLTMANDSLLKNFLAEEQLYLNDEDYIKQLQEFLTIYKDKYDYDAVFLASVATSRYYSYNGVDRVMEESDSRDKWYFDFLENGKEHELNIDNDKVQGADNAVCVFINCRVTDDDNNTIAVMGIGVMEQNLENLINYYEQLYNVQIKFLSSSGATQLSTITNEDLLYSILTTEAMQDHPENQTIADTFISVKYIPILDWYIVVSSDITAGDEVYTTQVLISLSMGAIVIFIILFIISNIVLRTNQRNMDLLTRHHIEYRELLYKATKTLYVNILEIDITNNCADGIETKRYFEELGISSTTPYDRALEIIAQEQIKPEFVEDYLLKFTTNNVVESYHKGVYELEDEIMMKGEGDNYNWMLIKARIFYWQSDNTIRMVIYHQNITAEKLREEQMLSISQKDLATGLFNKVYSTEHISNVLQASKANQKHALLIIDIDLFKHVNDAYGHPVGDIVIQEFAKRITSHFNQPCICGRIGGDEFIVLLLDIEYNIALERNFQALVDSLAQDVIIKEVVCPVSSSIGVSMYPDTGLDFCTLYKNADKALYKSKENGRNQYTIYTD